MGGLGGDGSPQWGLGVQEVTWGSEREVGARKRVVDLEGDWRSVKGP